MNPILCYTVNKRFFECKETIMAKKMTAYQKKLDYNNTYNRENYRSFSIRYNKANEKKIISWLEKQGSVKQYVTDLILADMEKKKTARKAKTSKTSK